MTGRKKRASGPVMVRPIGPRSVEFEGPRVLSTIQALGIRYMRNRNGGGWLVRRRDRDDLMAALEADGHQVQAELGVW